jgi:hypothetical protein
LGVVAELRNCLPSAAYEDELDDEKAWGAIYKRRELHTFMAQPDHVKAIKDYFLSLLEEVKRFQRKPSRVTMVGECDGSRPRRQLTTRITTLHT